MARFQRLVNFLRRRETNMKYVVALNDYEAHKGFKVKKDVMYMMDEMGNVYVKTLICQEGSKGFNDNFKIVGD